MINSARPVIDEFIIVDTGSTDNTVQVAQQLGCQVFEWGPSDNFAEPRNYGLDQAKGDWILHLDADDELLLAGQREVYGLVNQGFNEYTGYCFQIKEVRQKPFIAPSSGRLFPRRWNLRYKGHVHMEIKDFLNEQEKWVLVENGPHIKHTGHATVGVHRAKLERNVCLLHLDVLDEPENPDWPYYLAMSYKDLGQVELADNWARRALVLGNGNQPPWVVQTLHSCLMGQQLGVRWFNGRA